MQYIIPSTVSFKNYDGEDGEDLSDSAPMDQIEGDLNSSFLLKTLSDDQQWVASLLSQGFGRNEIAQTLGISVVTVHKIVMGIKVKFSQIYDVDVTKRERNFYSNLIMLVMFANPTQTPSTIEHDWCMHPALREYKKPDKYLITQWYNSIIDSVVLTRGGDKTMDDTKPTDADEPKAPAEGSEDAGDDDKGDDADKDESSKEDSGN